MRTLASIVTALLAGAVLSFAPPAEARTVGSGKVATEAREVGDFDAITTEGAIDIVVRQAAKAAVSVQADDNLLPVIETVVESRAHGRTLVVRTKRGESASWRGDTVKVTVDVVQLCAITSAGSGDVRVESLATPALKLTIAGSSDARLAGLDTDRLELSIAGSGDVVGAGRARQLKLGIAGSGDADLGALVADEVSVRIAGSGNANVTANRSLDVAVAGSGDVRYGGAAAAVNLSAAGSGTVRKR